MTDRGTLRAQVESILHDHAKYPQLRLPEMQLRRVEQLLALLDADTGTHEDGTVQFVYSDELATVFNGEQQETKRASHVEPVAYGNGCGWVADMKPSEGPVLGPFKTRAEALAAERAWLRENRGL